MTDGWIQTTHSFGGCWCRCGNEEHGYRRSIQGLEVVCRRCNLKLRAAARSALTALEDQPFDSDAERVAQHLELTLGAFGIIRADAEPQ